MLVGGAGEQDEPAACWLVPGPVRRFAAAVLERNCVDRASKSASPHVRTFFQHSTCAATAGPHREVVLRHHVRLRRPARGCAFFHAASRLDRPQLRKTGAGMAAAGLLGWTLVAVSPSDDTGQPTGWLPSVAVVILLAVMLVATLQLIGLRREVYQNPVGAQPPTGNQAAMASVEEARRKRDEARRLALRDPMMARELGIGRPGLKRGYDDGGLVDLNSASAEQLRALCGLPGDVAEAVVAARSTLGRFLQRGGRHHVRPDRRGVRADGSRPRNHHRGTVTMFDPPLTMPLVKPLARSTQ